MKKFILFLGCLLSLFILLLLFSPKARIYLPSKITANDLQNAFSITPSSGFYKEDLSVSMELPASMRSKVHIFYTTDGSVPTADSAEYTDSILIPADSELKNITLRAIITDADSQQTLAGPFTSTYFVGEAAMEFSNALVVSLSSDPEGLYSEETGILYPMADCGPSPEEWKAFEKQNCKQRGEEWIRNAHVDIFEPDGSHVISQEVGLCVDGDHGSMTHYPYSLKILSSSVYDDAHPTFKYDFFSYYNTKGTDFPHMQDYNNLVFRNGGNEYNAGEKDPEQKGSMIRWQIGSRLADEYGVFTAGERPAIVFLNGELYGVTILLDTYNRHNIGERLGLNRELMEIYKGGEQAVARLAGYEDLYYSYPDITKTPLTDPEIQKAFEEKVDIAELFKFYALEMFFNNTDFPKKNVTMWRYATADELTDSAVPYTSGKYFPLINDLDCSYDFRKDDDLRTAYLTRIKDGAALVGCSMQVPKYRGIFVNTLSDMLNCGLFDKAHMDEVIDKANADISAIAALYYTPGDEAQRQRNVEQIRQYAAERCRQIRDFINDHFETDYPYTLMVSAPDEGSSIHFSTTDLTHRDGDFTGTYYGDYDLTIHASMNEALSFDHWEVNGKRMDSPTLTLSKDLITDGQIRVTLVTKPASDAPALLISEVCSDGTNSWLELYNASKEVVSLEGYRLTNSSLSLLGFALPEQALAPGEVTVIGTDNTGVFRIEPDKTLYLKAGRRICDQISVPRTGTGESYGRQGETDRWKYYVAPTQGQPQ